MLTLYGDLDSGNVYKVRLLLAQLGIAYRRVDVTQNRGETTTAEFRAINPIGKIPTIVFDSILSAGQTRSQARSAGNSRTRLRSVSSVQRKKGDFRFSMAPPVRLGTSRCQE
jgi:hypothetical protein